MAKVKINIIYSILVHSRITDGGVFGRYCTPISIAAEVKELVDALIPSSCSDMAVMALGELYLRLLASDKILKTELQRIDPVNTYGIVQLYPEFTDDVDLADIAKNVEKVAPDCAGLSTHPTDVLRNGLEKLLKLVAKTNV